MFDAHEGNVAGAYSMRRNREQIMYTTAVERAVRPLPTIREVKPYSFIFERPGALPPVFCDDFGTGTTGGWTATVP